jgi:hypothetical protein
LVLVQLLLMLQLFWYCWYCWHCYWYWFNCPIVQLKVKVTLRPTVSRPVRLGVRRPSGTRDQFFFLLEMLFRQLWVCYFGVPSLTRGRVRNLLLLLVLASAVPLGSTLSDECIQVLFQFRLGTAHYAVDAPWYAPNTVIRRDLQIPTVREEICHYSSQYSARLSTHPNDLIVNLIELPDNRRLRRHLPNDLLTRFLV